MNRLILITEENLRNLIREETEAVVKKLVGYDACETINNSYLNIEQAASFLKLAQSSLYGLIHRRKIPFIKQGRRVLFERIALEKWIKGE